MTPDPRWRWSATLRTDVPTPLGTYGPGTPVYPLRTTPAGVVVCVDPLGGHLGPRCHTVTVPDEALHVEQTLQPTRA